MRFEEVTDPLVEVDGFRRKAESEGLALPEAMALATVDPEGNPRVRVVLYKGREERTVFFYTNYESDKARDLAHRAVAEVCFHYPSLQLQARLSGRVTKTSEQRSDAYFATRPRESQIGAWASSQSEALDSRVALDEAYARVEARYAGQEVPRPPHWGGYGLEVERVELWLGRTGRLHDRARFSFEDDRWTCQRLFP